MYVTVKEQQNKNNNSKNKQTTQQSLSKAIPVKVLIQSFASTVVTSSTTSTGTEHKQFSQERAIQIALKEIGLPYREV